MITTFFNQVQHMEFLTGKYGYFMQQNFYPLSEDIKEALDAIEKDEIGLVTCKPLEHLSIGTFPNFVDIHSNKTIYKLHGCVQVLL